MNEMSNKRCMAKKVCQMERDEERKETLEYMKVHILSNKCVNLCSDCRKKIRQIFEEMSVL